MPAPTTQVLRALLAPLYAYFEPRFKSLHEHLDNAARDVAEVVEGELRPHLDHRLDTVEDRVRWVDDRAAEARDRAVDAQEAARDVDRRLAVMEGRVTTDTQTTAELAVTSRRVVEGVRDEMAALRAHLIDGDGRLPELFRRSQAGDPYADQELAGVLVELVPGAADEVVGRHVGMGVDRLGLGTSAFLNWAQGHTGPAGAAGLWLNPPVTVVHEPGSVRPNEVNERIVEVPYALSVLGRLAPGASVLDFGATESTVSLSLASLGLEVHAADLRPYPLAHPRIHPVVGPIEAWSGPPQPLDAVLSLSALEHVGLGAYGEEATDLGLDRRIVERFAGWLAPGGELVLTAPYGRAEVTATQRVYDVAGIDALLEGWTVLDRRVGVQAAPGQWDVRVEEPAAETWDDGATGVVLLRATPL